MPIPAAPVQSHIASAGQSAPSLPFCQRWSLKLRFLCLAIHEFVIYDSGFFKTLLGLAGLLAGWLSQACGCWAKGFAILSKVHRSAWSDWASDRIERLIRTACEADEQGIAHPLLQTISDCVAQAAPTPQTARFFKAPERILQSGAIVLKSPGPKEKGVILLNYLFFYPVFGKFFDLQAITEKYYLVLEPTWCGYCDWQILSFMTLRHPVFVGATEPRDIRFLNNLGSNLIPVPISSNTWVDHRVFRPLDGAEKDIDIIMVAAWADYKRHWAFFSALQTLRRWGLAPRVALLGYVGDSKIERIRLQTQYYGVSTLIEMHERLEPAEVNRFLNRAKVHVLWSRREGWNRAIIEGMFAGVPCIVREGHNYGYHYPYINRHTGRYSTEGRLPYDLVEMIKEYKLYMPRPWVTANMSCQRTTFLLNEAIKAKAIEAGEDWTTNLAVKTYHMGTQCYWNREDEKTFEGDYLYLRSAMRPAH